MRSVLFTAMLLATSAQAGTLTTIGNIPAHADAEWPRPGFAFLGGKFYGASSSGGLYNQGALFSINPNTGAARLVYSFTGAGDGAGPTGHVISLNGMLYGEALSGKSGIVVYTFDPASGTLRTLYTISQQKNEFFTEGLTAQDGLLYGVSTAGCGLIFSLDPSSGVATTVYKFDGQGDNCYPQGPLLSLNGVLYGTTFGSQGVNRNSEVFSINPATGAETVLYDWNDHKTGAIPPLLARNGKLFGTTNGSTFAYSIDLKTSSYTPLPGMGGCVEPNGPLVALDGKLYGAWSVYQNCGYLPTGGVYQLDPGSGKTTPVYQFPVGVPGPLGAIDVAGSRLFGVGFDSQAGVNATGTVFSVQPESGTGGMLRTFYGPASPNSGLVALGKRLYGTSYAGGANNRGSVFSVNPRTGEIRSVYSFAGGSDGSNPIGELVPVGSLLYGVTQTGGTGTGPVGWGNGVLYSLDPATGVEALVHNFTGSDGSYPNGPLLLFGGLLYGNTVYGGAQNQGTLFSLEPASGTLTVLHSFGASGDLAYPLAGITAAGNTLYGVTDSPAGIFAFDTSTGIESVSYQLSEQPLATLLNLNGVLFGTTYSGGAQNGGTVFSFDPATGLEKTVASLRKVESYGPDAPVVSSWNALFGTLMSGSHPHDFGGVFKVDPTNGAEKLLYRFGGGIDGAAPTAGLLRRDKRLWGTTSATPTQGGAAGTVFTWQP